MQFEHLRLRNWRNFRQVDVALASRMFVVGPNASGKSNLLDVFRFLRHLTAEGGGLAQAVRARRGLSRLRSLHQKGRNSDVEIEVRLRDGGSVWSYLLAFNRADRQVGDDLPVVKRERVVLSAPGRPDVVHLDRPDENDRVDPFLLTQTAVQQVAQAREFRRLVECFGSVSYLHVVPQLVRSQSAMASDFGIDDMYGRDLLLKVAATAKQSRQARLKRISEVLKLAVPNLESLELTRDELNRPHLQAAFRHWRAPAAQQDEREFSDGTLRLIGLLWAMQDKAGPLLLEEPELSLHAAIVRQLAPFIARAQRRGGRQAFVSTHSDALMSDPGISAEEVLLVRPGADGSEVILGASSNDIRNALSHGLTAADVVMPMTQMRQMDLFSSVDI